MVMKKFLRKTIVIFTATALMLGVLVPASLAGEAQERAVYDEIVVKKIDNGTFEQPGKVIYAKQGDKYYIYEYSPENKTLGMLSWSDDMQQASSTIINLPDYAGSMEIGPDGNIYFTGLSTGKIFKHSGTTLNLLGEASTGSGPGAIAFNTNSNKVYVAHTGQYNIYEYSYPDLTRTSSTVYGPGPIYSVAGGYGNAIVYPDYFSSNNQSEVISFVPNSSDCVRFGFFPGKVTCLQGMPPAAPIAWLVGTDTQTNYLNGVHTIMWTANDNAGNVDGIGSRYFSINNNQPGKRDSSLNDYIAYRLNHSDGTLTIYDLQTGAVLGTATGLGNPESVSFLEDGSSAVVVDNAFNGFYYIDFAAGDEPDDPADPVYTITVTQDDIAVTDVPVKKGKTVKVVAKAYVDGVYNAKLTKKIKWSTSDKKTVTVSKGKIKGKKVGTAVITAYLTAENASSAVNVTVSP